MESLFVQKALPEDIPLLNSISMASKRYWQYPEDWLQHWRSDLSITADYMARAGIYKLRAAGKVAGFMALEKQQGFYEITHLWILPAFIGKGYGKKLLQEVMALEVTAEAEIRVEADPHAEGFYRRQGFVPFDRKESYPPGRYLPLMKMVYTPGR